MKFTVTDPKTGKYPDLNKIAKTEDWIKYFNVSGDNIFMIDEYGDLRLDNGNDVIYCPEGRFEVVFEKEIEE